MGRNSKTLKQEEDRTDDELGLVDELLGDGRLRGVGEVGHDVGQLDRLEGALLDDLQAPTHARE
jgi:hypothetical protein